MMKFIFFYLLLASSWAANSIPIKDNLLFAFEKCKSLSVNLEKGQLNEISISSFDLHCRKSPEKSLEFKCDYFDAGSNKKVGQEVFNGGSNLGEAELISKDDKKIKFLIGKGFASYESGSEHKVCAGIFIFEQDALKQQSSSLKSGLSN